MLNKKAAAAAVSALVSSSALQNPLFFFIAPPCYSITIDFSELSHWKHVRPFKSSFPLGEKTRAHAILWYTTSVDL